MNKKTATSLASRTIIFAVLILAIEFVSSHNDEIIQTSDIDVSYMILPLIIASTIIYAVAMVDVFLTGELSQAFSRGVVGFTVGLFLSLAIARAPYLQDYQPLGFWILIGVVIIVAAYLSSAVSRSHHLSSIKVLSISIAFLTLGYVSSQIVSLLSQRTTVEFPQSFETVIFWSFAAASALCLLGLLSGSHNPYLSYVGNKFGSASGLVTIFALAIFLLLYSFDLRPILANSYPNYVLPFEWGAVCVVCFAFYRSAKSYAAKFLAEDLSLGKWTRLFQKIEQKKDKVEEVSKIVKKFVDDGNKEGILIYLTSTLIENQASTPEIVAAISKLVEYWDLPLPKLAFLSKLENRERENKVRRKTVLQQTLMDTANALRLHVPASLWLEVQTVEEKA
jgi:hypothetical protein